jgi:hypothetical protein
MMILLLPLIIGLVLLLALAVAGRAFLRSDPRRLAKRLKAGGGLAMLGIGLFLILRGQIGLGMSLLAAGLGRAGGGTGGFPGGSPGGFPGGTGWPGGGFPGGGFPGGGWPGGFPGGRSRGTPRGGGASSVETRFVSMRLDHDTSTMDGTVREGRFAGRTLSALSDAEALALWREAGADHQSRLVLEAYLDRRLPEWREDVERDGDAGAGGAGRARGSGGLTEKEAYEVLGLRPGAGEAEIRAAHRRLMKEMHPDQGGSTVLAARLNEARDLLLKRR